MRSLAADPINMEKRLQEIVDSPRYREEKNPQVQRLMLKSIIEASHKMAKGLLWKDPEVVRDAQSKADAIRELYTNHTDLNWKGNWLRFLTGMQSQEREVMNSHGLFAKEK